MQSYYTNLIIGSWIIQKFSKKVKNIKRYIPIQQELY